MIARIHSQVDADRLALPLVGVNGYRLGNRHTMTTDCRLRHPVTASRRPEPES